ncbi:hypothetical protein C5167_051169 [Papaver somniferum]|uniref:Uncharacterized protein n=1 Tax=Papaver somniferum TaxID=3469 RepID=A0A4Y7KS58_PAPSO|nr:uncharacterized protein LOC113306672 [Papaver somniferum]RZC75686.1 hypothetical protein C5167_051169 [Papaver somniferum]
MKPNQDGTSSSSSKQKSVATITKSETSEIPKSSSSKITSTTTTTVKVKPRKVYSLPGQKHDPPEEREPLRIFYGSLFEQIPSSNMAEFWMMEHGLLSPERAKRAYEKKQKLKQQQKTGTPIKSQQAPSDRAESSSQRQQGKKRIASGSDDDEEFTGKKKKGKG